MMSRTRQSTRWPHPVSALWLALLLSVCLALTATNAQAAQVRVMTLGDSVVTGGAGNFRTPLKAMLEADGYAVEYVGLARDADGNRHEGHGGWTPEQVRLVLGTTYTADVYVLYAGLNGLTDASLAPGAEGLGTHALAMRDVLDAVFSRVPNARVVLACIGLVQDAHSPVNARVREFNRQLTAMAATYGHADRLWLADAQGSFRHDPTFFEDGAHPSQKGFDALAAKLHPAVLQAAQSARPLPIMTAQRLALGLVVLALGGGVGVLLVRRRHAIPGAAIR